MARKYTELTFTNSVKEAQGHYGSRQQAARIEAAHWEDTRLGDRERSSLQSETASMLRAWARTVGHTRSFAAARKVS